MSKNQQISVTCPACKSPFATEVHQVIDVATHPELKWQLLAGKLNVASCPTCKMAGMLGMPFAYHDPDNELLFVFMPHEAGLSADDQEKLIGRLTQDVMNSLPTEKRKGYLLQPKTFMRLQTMFDSILEADGITKEMLEAQAKRSELINRLLETMEEEETFLALVEDNREQMDYEFFQTLTATAGAAAESGDESFANELLALRSKLLKLTTPVAAGLEASDLDALNSPEQLLEGLLEAKDDREFEALTALGRPLIDYGFYLMLATRIEEAEGEGRMEEADSLSNLREKLLDLTAKMDAEAQEAIKAAGDLLNKVFQSEDAAKVIEEHVEEIDDLFFYLLTANIEAAEKGDAAKNAERIARLKEIAGITADMLEKRMPPRLRLVNQLLRLEEDGERERLLEEQQDIVDEDLMKVIDALIEQFQGVSQDTMTQRLQGLSDLVGMRVAS